MKKFLALLIISMLVFTVPLTGCTESTSEEGTEEKSEVANPGKTRTTSDALIVSSAEGFTGNFLPYYAISASEINIVSLTFSELLDSDAEGNYRSDLAEFIGMSEDNKTVKLKILENAIFSDGTPVTTKDVAFSFNTLADPSYTGPLSYLSMNIEGYDEYYEDTEGVVKSMSGLKIINDREIEITFYDSMRTNMETIASVQILPEHYYGFDKGSMDQLKSQVEDIMGSGPYILSNYEPAQFVELTVNENYFGEKKPQIKKIIAKVTQSATVIDELLAGEIDLIELVNTPEEIEIIKEAGYIDLLPYENSGYNYFEFNCKEAPTDDINVRQALTYGLDRQTFVDSYYKGLATTQDSVLYSASWAYSDEVNDFSYNPEKAIELLEESGWVLNSDGYRYKDNEKLVIELSATSENAAIEFLAPIMIENYREIGVELLLNYLDFNSLSTLVFDEKVGFDMYSMGVGYGSPDPDQIKADFHTDFDVEGGYNASCYNNEVADKLLDEAVLIMDKDEAKILYQEWAEIVSNDMPRMVLSATKPYVAISSRVKGHKPSAFEFWSTDILNMYLED